MLGEIETATGLLVVVVNPPEVTVVGNPYTGSSPAAEYEVVVVDDGVAPPESSAVRSSRSPRRPAVDVVGRGERGVG